MSKTRRGFTMIELLVVVSIIAILAAMTLSVIGDSMNQAREVATATTILKINKYLEERVAAFQRGMKGGRLADLAAIEQQNFKRAFGMPVAAVANTELKFLRDPVAEILAYKREFRQSFPQRFLDIRDFKNDPVDVISSDLTSGSNGVLDVLDILGANPDITLNMANHQPDTESSELLYYILTGMDVYGSSPVGSDQFTAAEVQDTDGDGLMEFVDNWGRPLRFYRWPTRLIDPDYTAPPATAPWDEGRAITATEREFANTIFRGLPASPPSVPVAGINLRDALTIDPDDTVGRLFFELRRLDPDVNPGVPDLSLYYNEAIFHTPDTFHSPLIVSAGRDGVLGLYEPYYVDFNANSSTDGTGSPTVNDATTDPIYDINGNGVAEANETEDPNGNGTFDSVFGNLAAITIAAGIDPLTDNISNRNRRVGGRN